MFQGQSKANNIFFARFVSLQILVTIGVTICFSQMTSCAVPYDVIYQSFTINSQYLRTWEVDSPAKWNNDVIFLGYRS